MFGRAEPTELTLFLLNGWFKIKSTSYRFLISFATNELLLHCQKVSALFFHFNNDTSPLSDTVVNSLVALAFD